MAMAVALVPPDAPADAPAQVVVTGAAPGRLTLALECTDAAGISWRSTTALGVDRDGRAGTAALADPTEPYWAMRFETPGAAPVAFSAPAGRHEVVAQVTQEGFSARATGTRQWAPGRPPRLEQGLGYRLTVFLPDETAVEAGRADPRPAVAVVPGVTAGEPVAAALAMHGYVAAVVDLSPAEGSPGTLVEVPLETVAAGLRAVRDLPEADGGRFAVHCSSVGAPGALGALAEFRDVAPRLVVAVSPSSLVWQATRPGGRPPSTAAWSLHEEPLPWLPVQAQALLGQLVERQVVDRLRRRPHSSAVRSRTAYENALDDRDAVESAAVRVEDVAAPILAISGSADGVWPASSMARNLLDRRGRDDDLHLDFDGAGHLLRPPVVPTTVLATTTVDGGGSAAATALASAAAWQTTLTELSSRLR